MFRWMCNASQPRGRGNCCLQKSIHGSKEKIYDGRFGSNKFFNLLKLQIQGVDLLCAYVTLQQWRVIWG